jgi:uncharacterized protein YbjT (DUF2867 family)
MMAGPGEPTLIPERNTSVGLEGAVDTDQRVVAVTGATGRQGGAVARQLLSAGWRVRALTRKPQSAAARRIAASGAEVVEADMGDLGALVRAFHDAYGVFSVQNPMISGLAAEVVQGRNVGDAAREAGVRHLVYASAGVDGRITGVGSWDSKVRVQEHLEHLGLPLTVLRPVAFMELMTDKGFYPAVTTWRLMPRLAGETRPIGWISVDDVGAIAARAFADSDAFVGTELNLAADVRSIAECRELWRAAFGRRPRRFPMPVGMFERLVSRDLTTMWRWLRTADLSFDPTRTRAVLPSASTVPDWLETRRHSGGPAAAS